MINAKGEVKGGVLRSCIPLAGVTGLTLGCGGASGGGENPKDTLVGKAQ